MRHQLATVALGPLLLLQGLSVRRRIPRLAEPPGPKRGALGAGPTLRVLIAGDSAAAGVGASSQDEALVGQIASGLAASHRVEWALEAKNGATTASTLAHLHQLPSRTFDLAVTSLGVNDVTAGVGRARWRRQQRELRALLSSKFGASLVIACGLPPVDGFPSLPQPLRWYLGSRAIQLSRDLEADVAGEPGCRFLELRFTEDAGLMAPDGFHPGPVIYSMWGERVVRLALEVLGAPPDP